MPSPEAVQERPSGPIPQVAERIERDATDLPQELRATIASYVSALLRMEGKWFEEHPTASPNFEQLCTSWVTFARQKKAETEATGATPETVLKTVRGELWNGLLSAAWS
jgi:hypothetical protein